MKEMQFTAVVMMTLMAMALIVLLPRKVVSDRVANRSRWLMVGGLVLLALQFLIQYLFRLREMGVTQAVMVNLTFFIPISALISLSMLNLQRQGKLQRTSLWIGIPTWIVAMAILLTGSRQLLWAEVGASMVYGIMQVYYSALQLKELTRMETVLDDYYDHNRSGLLKWMKWSCAVLTVIALSAPVVIFSSGLLLVVYALSFFVAVYVVWFNFVRYLVSGEVYNMSRAEESEEARNEKPAVLSDEAGERARKAVERWVNAGKYLRQGITSPEAAKEMRLPRYLLTAWVKEAGYSSFSRWITALRLEKAKALMGEHPEWSNETIADNCGISRTHFHRVFKEEEGLSPTDYQTKIRNAQ